MASKTIVAPTGFTTITVFHDSQASRKSERGWKVVIPLNANVTQAVRLDVFDGIDTSDGSLLFEEAVKQATKVVREHLHRVPKWETDPEGGLTGVGVAKWRF